MIDSSKVIETVKLGGPLAASELGRLLDSGVAYPGDVSDVIAMTSDYSRLMFLTPVAAIAWGYLEAHGIARYVGDDDHVNGFVSAITSGRAYDGRYVRKVCFWIVEHVETDIGNPHNPSSYGSTDSCEFFAESFANMTGGKPNAYGKAMRDWFGKRK